MKNTLSTEFPIPKSLIKINKELQQFQKCLPNLAFDFQQAKFEPLFKWESVFKVKHHNFSMLSLELQNLPTLGQAIEDKIKLFESSIKPLITNNIFKEHLFSPPKLGIELNTIKNIQQAIESHNRFQSLNTKPVQQKLEQASSELSKNGKLSASSIISLISILISLLGLYPIIKEFYQDIRYDPITEICGVIEELERQATLIVEITHKGGTPLYNYPKGKKSEYYLLEGTQLCLIYEPKGNAKRVKVIFQDENDKQMIGYLERTKLKRIYKR